ncbi:32309_t:CDS:2, partial [Racocetra persica]
YEDLIYGKAVDALAKSLRELINKSSDPTKVQKASNLLKARGVTLLAGPLTDLLDCYEGNAIDKLWLTVENKKPILKERNVNEGTNCIQLVSCKDIHINNIGNKRNYENENPETPEISVGNDGSFSENNKHEKHHEEDEEIILLESPIVKKLISIGGIARYRIVFLAEENNSSPIKSAFKEEEWLKLEIEWRKIEEMVAPVSDGMDTDQENLLKKYDDAIKKATIGYSVNLSEIVGVFNECTLINRNCYVFYKEWPLQWIQSIYNAFLAINPLHDSDLSEYAYRDKIVNPLIENVFLEINEVIRMKTGEVENLDRKVQKDSNRLPGIRRATGWEHDALLVMKVKSIEYQIGFGEIVGNACEHDDAKMERDREKILKCK